MRKREKLLYTGLTCAGLLLLAFLIYSPVLFAWSDRKTTQMEGGERRPDRELTIVLFNSVMQQAPWLYSKLLALHGRYYGLKNLKEDESITTMMILVPHAYEVEPETDYPSR